MLKSIIGGLGLAVIAFAVALYCIRTKTFFIFPGKKYEEAKWYESLIVLIGSMLFSWAIFFT